MVQNYFIISCRHFFRNRSFTFINILGLSIGLACCFLIGSWAINEWSFDQFHEQHQQVYRLFQVDSLTMGKSFVTPSIPYAIVPLLQQQYPEIEQTTRIRRMSNFSVSYYDKKFYEHGFLLAETSFFQIFSFPFIRGSAKTALSDLYSIVLTESMAHKYFGSENPLGKTLQINGNQHFTVTAIIEDVPVNSSLQFDFVIPFQILGETRLTSWSWESQGYLKLKPDTNVETFLGKIQDDIIEHSPNGQSNLLQLQPLRKMHLYSLLGAPEQLSYVYIFIIIALILLLIAAINYINLQTAQACKREKEIGIRKVLGASQKQLVTQFLAESILIALAAMFLACGLIELMNGYFNDIIGREIPLFFFHGIGSTSILLVPLLLGIAAGIYPAFYLASLNPHNMLQSNSRHQRGKGMRTFLVIFQFTAAITFMTCIFIIRQQLHFIHEKPLGYTKENVLSIPVNEQLRHSDQQFREELLRHPQIIDVTSASNSPTYINNVNPVEWQGKTSDEKELFYFHLVDHNYVPFFDLTILNGRNFDIHIASDSSEAFLVNEAAVRRMNLEDPLGEHISMCGYNGTIIGVIKDFHFRTLDTEIKPLLLTPLPFWRSDIFVKIRGEKVNATIDYIHKIHDSFAPDFPFSYRFLYQELDTLYRPLYRTASVVEIFTIIAIIISCLGLLGLATFSIQQKRKEIGIRKALGSSGWQIALLLCRSFSRWILVSLCLAGPIAYWLAHFWLQDFAYRISLSLWHFLLPGLFIFIIGFATIAFQTFRAAMANPVDSLRYE